MFWQALDLLHRWERKNLPGADTPQGSEVLIWLLKSRNRFKPLKDLYRSSRFSEPTVRACLKQFVDNGFAVIETNGHDMRTRVARATAKLEAAVGEYRKRFKEVTLLAEREGVIGAAMPPPSEAVLSDANPDRPSKHMPEQN